MCNTIYLVLECVKLLTYLFQMDFSIITNWTRMYFTIMSFSNVRSEIFSFLLFCIFIIYFKLKFV